MRYSRLADPALALCAVLIANPAGAQQAPFGASSTPATPAPLAANLELTLAAWNAFRAGHNEQAIAKADQCIQQFRGAADRIEARLEAEKASLPKGKSSPADQRLVDRYEVLHDVARCFLIKGMAQEKLAHRDAAQAAYAAATKYKNARVRDPATDSFCSPAEKAAQRLENLKGAPADDRRL